ncbi:Protein trichome birefringence-like 42 [Vitis vinifera]|uniref:Protein trichome birefringence-like 42 n=1 Tax=Vitis vinifera TaxID=29760 RepID=A0A438GZ14_VITVI|nr:Protein trichome birefringence-like 42 [Vitis vinifera]
METARPEMEISEPSKPNMDFHEPSKIIENPKLMNHSNEKCDIFDGKWVYDPEGKPLYGPQCPFLHDQVSCRRNGRPDSNYEKWSWQPNECEIPRFNVTDMFERLRGKRLIMVGDSLNGNMWASLACLLYSAIPPSRSHIETNRIPRSFRSKDYNCSVEFYMNPFLVQTYVNKTDGTRVLRLDQISDSARRWQGADIMVFNTGHWWMHKGRFQSWDLFQYKGKLVEEMERESAFGMGLRTWARWVDRYVDRTKTTVFFRSLSPQHSGQHYCYNQSQPILDEFLLPPFPHSMARIVEGRIRRMRTPVRYLNITKLSQYRKDAHPSIYSSKREKLMINQKQSPDCSHWCLPGLPDTWNMLLYVSMVSSNSSSWHLMV